MQDFLKGKSLISLGLNLPGPLSCRKLADWGAKVIKIEPPMGDQLKTHYPEWYDELHKGIKVIRMNLKEEIEDLFEMLNDVDLFITSQTQKRLESFGLDKKNLQNRFPKLSIVQIFAYPDLNQPGHDLNFQSESALFEPPQLPRILAADYLGAERATSLAVAALLSKQVVSEKVILSEMAERLAEPFKFGATKKQGILGGELATYNLYETKDGWISLAAIEPGFQKTLKEELGSLDKDSLQKTFSSKTTKEWLAWAKQFQIPLSMVKK